MKVIILGAGGIGSLVGALLSKENDVVLIGRKEHIDEINKNGLIINGAVNGNFKVKAETKVSNIDEDTLIILTTKAIDNKKSIEDIKNLIKENTIILCLQNGIGNEEQIKNIVDCKVIRGIATTAIIFLEPGKVSCSNLGNIFLEKSDVSQKIVDMINKAGINTEIAPDIKDRIWKKLIVNCSMNPLTAIFRVKNGDLAKCLDLVKSIVHELVLVANKECMDYNQEKIYETVCNIIENSSQNKSSMLQDILKGRKTEIDYLNGAVVEFGKKYKIKCPVNESLVAMIKFLENKS